MFDIDYDGFLCNAFKARLSLYTPPEVPVLESQGRKLPDTTVDLEDNPEKIIDIMIKPKSDGAVHSSGALEQTHTTCGGHLDDA